MSRLYALRKESHKSVSRVSREIFRDLGVEISGQTILNAEEGKVRNIDTLRALAKYYKVSLDEII